MFSAFQALSAFAEINGILDLPSISAQKLIQPLGDQPPPLRQKVAVALGGEQGRIGGDALAREGLVAVVGDQFGDIGSGGLVADAAVGAAESRRSRTRVVRQT